MKQLSKMISKIINTFTFIGFWARSHDPTHKKDYKISKVDAAILLYLNEQSEPINGLKIFKVLVNTYEYRGSNSGVYSSLYKLDRMQLLDHTSIAATRVSGGRKQTVYQISHNGKRVTADLTQFLNISGINFVST